MSEAHCGTQEDFNNHIKSIGTFAAKAGYEITPVGFDPHKHLLPGMCMHGVLRKDENGALSFEPDVVEIPKADVKPGQFKSMFLNSWPWGEREKVEAQKAAVREEQEKYHYEYMKAKCHANPGQYGVGLILSDGTWVSHEEAIALAHHRPSVNHRNVAGAGEIPFLVTEYGMISEKDLLPAEDKRAAKAYAERQEQAKLSEKHTGTITAHTLNADGSESMTLTFPDCLLPGAEVLAGRDLLDAGIAQILQKCNASDLLVVPNGYEIRDTEGKVVGNSNSGIRKYVSGKEFIDTLLPVPPLVPETPPETCEKFKQTLKDAGIDVRGFHVPAVVAAIRAEAEKNDALWNEIANPALGVPHDQEAIKKMNEAIFEKLSERATPTNPAMVDAVNDFTRHMMKGGSGRVPLPTPDEDDPQPIIVQGE